MKNKRMVIYSIFFSIIIILLTTSLISAGFLDWFKKITGEATQNVNVNISIGAGTAPVIVNVSGMADFTTNQGPAKSELHINFTVLDSDGAANLNITSAMINLTKIGEATRGNSSCAQRNSWGNFANYTCNVTMWWFDASGNWTINISIRDLSSNLARNITNEFNITSATAFELSPATLTYAAISAGATNQTPNNGPILLNNTGNKAIAVGSIDVNATNLKGETNSALALWSGNFSANVSSGTTSCAGKFLNDTGLYNIVSPANLSIGNYTANNNVTGQEQLFLCLTFAGSELSQQAYSTSSAGAWTIRTT